MLNASILRDNLGNLLANSGCTVLGDGQLVRPTFKGRGNTYPTEEMQFINYFRTHPPCQFHKHFPLWTRLTNSRTWNFWAKNDPSLRASFRYSPWHFVASGCR